MTPRVRDIISRARFRDSQAGDSNRVKLSAMIVPIRNAMMALPVSAGGISRAWLPCESITKVNPTRKRPRMARA